jgi:adenine-specific DNA-methyltransferase
MRTSSEQMALSIHAISGAPDTAPSVRPIPERATLFPPLRYMGSKHRLLPWLFENLDKLSFSSALDLFAGTGAVSYLFKAMGKEVTANDFLNLSHQLTAATVENSETTLTAEDVARVIDSSTSRDDFVERTFSGIFFTPSDLMFLDIVSANVKRHRSAFKRAIVLSSIVRACVKKQPRGVFTVADPTRYDDGRRDLRLSLNDHFLEGVNLFNGLVFDNSRANRSIRRDAFEVPFEGYDLVYMDPPYVPRADDNCYIKRYHFIEGLMSYWKDVGTEVQENSKVKKIPKRFTPFSYRAQATAAFDSMFRRFAASTLVLSYSSNGYPDLSTLVATMKQYKKHVDVVRRVHRYHFGTHVNVSQDRKVVNEYLIIGT